MKLFVTASRASSILAEAAAPAGETIELRTVPSVEEALRIMEKERFDCVIADADALHDPDRRFRNAFEETQNPGCPLMLGVTPGEEIPVEILDEGVDGCLDMPLDARTLETLVHACCRLDEEMLEQRRVLRQRDEEIATLVAISNIITSNLEFVPLLAAIAQTTSKMLNAERTTIFMYHPEREELDAVFAEGLEPGSIVHPASVGISGHVAATRRILNVEDAYRHPLFYDKIDRQTGYVTRSILGGPLISPTGDLIGVIECLNKRQGPFTETDERSLDMLSPLFAITIENALLYKDLQEQVAHNERMTAEKIRSERLAVVGRMANSVTRDIADPMEEIVAHAARLGREDITQGERDTTSQAIERIVDHLVDLAQELLDFSRDELEITRDRCTIREIMEYLAVASDNPGAPDRLSFDTPLDGMETIRVDAAKLTEAVMDVIAVLRALTEAPLPFTITLDGDDAVMTVSPLPASVLDRFMHIHAHPFSELETKHGIGLKLAVARRIVEAHGGAITRDSECLYIRIPDSQTGG